MDAESIYGLLPAFIRLRDAADGGGTLRALVEVIARQAAVVDAGLDQLYDDQFIETCAPWVVPYIGDLIGFTPLRPLAPPEAPGTVAATRAEVADTIGLRRRKGTLGMLEQLAADVTGWPGVAVEFFARLATAQYVRNHLRPGDAIADVHSPVTALDTGGAFDRPPRTADVRRIERATGGRGRYNIANIGLFVWRLKPYTNLGHPARPVGANRYTLDPFGGDVALVNPPHAAPAFSLAGRASLPFFLQRYPLHEGITPYAAPGAVVVYRNGVALPAPALGFCNLATWAPPTAAGIEAAVDPVLGRLVFAQPPAAGDAIAVDYTDAFSGDYGGGAYERPVDPDEAQVEAPLPVSPVPAFAAIAGVAPPGDEVVEILDSGIRDGDLALDPGAHLLVVRATDLQRPVLTGTLTITAAAGARVTLRGLGVGGALMISGAGPLTVRLEHCTVRGGVNWSSPAVAGTLVLDHTLSGALAAHDGVTLDIADSAVDAGSDAAAAISGGGGGAAGSLTLRRSTVLGTVAARTIPLLENSIVTGTAVSAERQAGCVRYSFVPRAGSQTPRRFRCQPDLETDARVADALAANPALSDAQRSAIAASVAAWLLPAFTSRVPGQPGYLQLMDATPAQIRTGAESDAEMGVFFALFTPARDSNLRARLDEYLRIGLEAGVIHAT